MPRIVSAINVCCEAILAFTESNKGSRRLDSDAEEGDLFGLRQDC